MRASGLAFIAVAALLPFAGCDLTQKPQTGAVRVGMPIVGTHGRALSPPSAPEAAAGTPAQAQDQEETTANAGARSDRSIRLYGRGVSRTRQTRV